MCGGPYSYNKENQSRKVKSLTNNSWSFLPLRFACGRQKQVSRRDFIWETLPKIASFIAKTRQKI